ncbi:hypothetical protein [Corynebacterium sp.]|uniref:hypothetical protein n=1 Tax=Corynebacterium TaxID=1716 RepID=UPI002647C209|nr:hypothetical protein [Corynebacterium sp.]MDN5723572.1 hypothetical protein [Corynebacterium sp.]MDN6283674.1 hypothetical protein [Corynebacterium sp.]MDN6367856.1 hypothetical protein [Corynebacterium sp.]MDN6376959.1 hypothetical protein [Corynebacterium sp.]MDN6397118.1 hypothetical protein [Corynebacterium sp.]
MRESRRSHPVAGQVSGRAAADTTSPTDPAVHADLRARLLPELDVKPAVVT